MTQDCILFKLFPSRTEALKIAHEKNIANGSKNAMITKSVADGVEVEIFLKCRWKPKSSW